LKPAYTGDTDIMKEKELKKLSRSELLELLLEQTRRAEELSARLEKAEKELKDRQLRVDKAGDLARAVLDINGVMNAAQRTADQYLANITRMEDETKKKCDEMLKEARRQAENIIWLARHS